MEKGGFRRLGRLFHRSESSEDSEPDASRETPLPSPYPSPALPGRRQHRHSIGSSPPAAAGERKKRSAFGNWRLKKKQPPKERQAAAAEADSGQLSAPASPSLSLASSFTATASEPTTPTDRLTCMFSWELLK
ncbi:UNVERIFIED_CONTAM: hypothetical protein K2H54_068746 [Gekko kuhli]